jgi:hypothetical protein
MSLSPISRVFAACSFTRATIASRMLSAAWLPMVEAR